MALTQRDRDSLTPAQQAQIQAYTDQWNSATTDAERAAANAGANAIRAQAGYSGGDNGISYRAPNTYERADAIWLSGGGSSNNYGNSGYGGSANSRYGGDSLAAQLQQQLIDSQNSYAQALAEQKAANEAAVQKAVNSLEQQKTSTDRSYDDYARQAYIDKMNAQKYINQRLAAQGITGGAAESTLLGLSTSYADALRSMEQGRIRDLEGLDRAITDARLTGDIEGANAAANTIREQTASYSDTLKYLLDRAEAQNARQTAYDREDAATSRAWAQQLALNALNNGYMPDGDTLTTANMSTDYAAALLDAINRQKAQEQADWRAGYGDYGALNDLGVDTTRLTSQQLSGGSRSGSGTQSGTSSLMSGDIYARMADAGASDYGTAYDMLRSSGYSVTDANRYASYFAETYLPSRTGTQAAAMAASTGGMNESLFNQEARTIMAYLGQGMVNQAQSRLARIWNSLSASQQQALNNALVNNGYTG